MFTDSFIEMIDIGGSSGVPPRNLFCTYCTDALLQATVITEKKTVVEIASVEVTYIESVCAAHVCFFPLRSL
jgi:hypothetical protein